MNILLFVTSMILLLALLTFARIETYRSFSVLQGEFNKYMRISERSEINETAAAWYKKSVAEKSTASITKNAKGKARSKLSFIVFVDNEKRTKYAKEYPQLLILTKKLIRTLYGNMKFYQEMEQNQPGFIDALLQALGSAAEPYFKNKKKKIIKRAEDLSILMLGEPDLDDAWYKILSGTLKKNELLPEQKTTEAERPMVELPSGPEEDGSENDDQEHESESLCDYRSPQGYYSLLDYITLEDAARIRVFLASEGLLSAIFDDPATVADIIKIRHDLFRSVDNGSITTEAASTQFKTQFLPRVEGMDETILDFSVTKTNPRNYE